jgi:hypothetical protein
MATLDAIDVLTTVHASELATERQANRRLSDKLDHCIDFVKAALTERDDLLEAVDLLLEKGVLVSNHQTYFNSG